MGIRVVCPNGHKLNVKAFLAGKKGICPHCSARFEIPAGEAVGKESESAAAGAAAMPEPFAFDIPELDIQAPQSLAPTQHPTTAPAAFEPAVIAAPVVTPVAAAPIFVAPITPAGVESHFGVAASVAPKAQQPAAPLVLTPNGYAPVGQPAVQSDPFAEAPTATWYLRPASGGQFGPAEPSVMKQWLAEGRISADALVWREGWIDWLKAETVFRELAPAVSAPAVMPTAVHTGFSGILPDDLVIGGPAVSATPRTPRRPVKKGPSQTVIVSTILGVCIFLLVVLFVVIWLTQPGKKKEESRLTLVPVRASVVGFERDRNG